MTAELVTDALVMAIWRRGRPRELLHHSDRGSQYTSEAFQRLMAEHGVTCSLSRSGNVWDNAAMESFFSSLKVERVARKIYRTRDQARADVFDYIERFYNPRRRHSTIGYLSPMEFEAKGAISLGWCLPNRQQLSSSMRRRVRREYCFSQSRARRLRRPAGAGIFVVGMCATHWRMMTVPSLYSCWISAGQTI